MIRAGIKGADVAEEIQYVSTCRGVDKWIFFRRIKTL